MIYLYNKYLLNPHSVPCLNYMEGPGDSNGLVYLNGEAVYLPQPLNAYDVIEMGESTFLFVPFCGEHYMWEDDK